ncbi:hypothetical protein BJF84_13395 [Rhodococcus sp. CUA-806]|jgi:hypothetical protein|nr:hypothetical protein BJF84_13395 [Rhodococcus sp. CUA-806]
MGIDVQLTVAGDISDEQLEQANAHVSAHDPGGFGLDLRKDGRFLLRDQTYDERVQYYSLSRYWGPSYPRGYWPTIYAAIRVLQAAFPGMAVYYGDDIDDEDLGDLCTREYLEQMWTRWLEIA